MLSSGSVHEEPQKHDLKCPTPCIFWLQLTAALYKWVKSEKDCNGLVRDLNPGPLAPEARIIPLDQRANS